MRRVVSAKNFDTTRLSRAEKRHQWPWSPLRDGNAEPNLTSFGRLEPDEAEEAEEATAGDPDVSCLRVAIGRGYRSSLVKTRNGS